MRRTKKTLTLAAKIAITFGLFAWVLSEAKPDEIGHALQDIGIVWALGGVLYVFLLSLLQTQRWCMITALIDRPWPFRPAWHTILIGLFFSQFLPTSIGGDVMRVWMVHRAGSPLSKAFNSVAFDRLVALLMMAAMAAVGLVLLPELVSHHPMLRLAMALCAVGTVGAVIGPFLLQVVRLPAAWEVSRPIQTLRTMAADARVLMTSGWATVGILALTFAMQVSVCLLIWGLALAAGAQMDLLQCMVLIPLVILAAVLPLSIGGWGLRESAMIVAFRLMGVDAALAVSVSVLFGLLLLISGIPGGVVWLRNRSVSSVHN